jgi:hypothetical protein
MNLGWDNGETQELVVKLHGRRQWQAAHPSVRSVIDRAHFAEYHYHEAKDLLNNYCEQKLNGKFMMQVHADQDEYDEFSDVMLRIRAHVTAVVQSLHALPDTCAHVLHYSLALNRERGAPRPRGITSKSVLLLMAGKPELASLRSLFSDMTNGPGFDRLDSLNNHAKHRSVVRPKLSEDWTGKREQKYLLLLESFSYEGKFFPEIDVREFMQQEHDRMQHLMVDTGVELNNVLKAKAV